MARFGIDVRPEERRALFAMSATLAVVIGAHTMLETARDTMFLEKLPASRLAFVYGALAVISLLLGRFGGWLSSQLGRRASLALTLVGSAFIAALIALRPPTTMLIYVFYVATGVIATLTTMQFWLVAAELFTVSQGKRLFGYLAAGGVIGAVGGASIAALVLRAGTVATVTGTAAALFWAAAMLVAFALPPDEGPEAARPLRQREVGALQEEANPRYARLLMALVAISTATVLVSDYLFKASSAATVKNLGTFFAVFYAITNVASLVVQLGVSGPLIRRMGVTAAVLVFPILLIGASTTALVTGAFAATLALKAIDGALRHSLHRVSSELLLLPLSPGTRNHVKTLLDTLFSRGIQAAVAVCLLALAMLGLATPRVLAAIVLALGLGWLGVAVALRFPYLEVFRKALALGRLSSQEGGSTLNIPAVESLMEAISSSDEQTAIAALDILAQAGRPRLIPALALRHPSEAFVLRALALVATPDRKDWLPHVDHLLTHPSVEVRSAAVRATAAAGREEVVMRGLRDPDPAVRTSAAFFSTWGTDADPAHHPAIEAILDLPGDDGFRYRQLLLDVIASYGDARHRGIVRACADRDGDRKGALVGIANAVRATGELGLLGYLIRGLRDRTARPAARGALQSLGEPAFRALAQAYDNDTTNDRVRSHIPRTLMRFHTQASVDFLTKALATEKKGRTRFKVLRALNHLSAEGRNRWDARLKFDRPFFEREALKNLTEHGRLLGIHAALLDDAGTGETPVRSALLALINDKVDQAHERAFRCLGLSHRGEDIHGVFLALTRGDKRVRANAAEFLDALSFEVPELRETLRVVLDDIDLKTRAVRVGGILSLELPKDHDAAVRSLLVDPDELLAAMAAYHVFEAGIVRLAVDARRALDDRPEIARLGADPQAPPSELQ